MQNNNTFFIIIILIPFITALFFVGVKVLIDPKSKKKKSFFTHLKELSNNNYPIGNKLIIVGSFLVFVGFGVYLSWLIFENNQEKMQRNSYLARAEADSIIVVAENLESQGMYQEALDELKKAKNTELKIKSLFVTQNKTDNIKSRIERKKLSAEKEAEEKKKLKAKSKFKDKYINKGYIYIADTKKSKGKITDKNLNPINGLVFDMHDNGNLSELIEYRFGEKVDDNVKIYFTNGNLKFTKSKNSETNYYENGNKRDKKQKYSYYSWFENGSKHHEIVNGNFKKYYPSGKVAINGSYKKQTIEFADDASWTDGKYTYSQKKGMYANKVGKWIQYYENGQKMLERNHNDRGYFISDEWVTYFHENGNRAEERKLGTGTKNRQGCVTIEERNCFDENDRACDCANVGYEYDDWKNNLIPSSSKFGCDNSNVVDDLMQVEYFSTAGSKTLIVE
tara:strand:+ start:129 stop:1481 length:1353 start_codon:yes stop_codon:yes gene_type:complete